MQGSVLKSYQIGLGFQFDEETMRKFHDTVRKVHVAVKDFSVAMVGLAVAVEEAIRRTASNYESLFYLSQRTGVAANNLKALAYAFSQIGLQAGQAGQAISTITSKFADTPGLEGWLKGIVGAFEGPDGAVRAIARHYKEILDIKDVNERKLKESTFRLELRSQGLGDPEMYRQQAQNWDELIAREKEALELYAKFGLDSKKVSEDAKAASDEWRKFWEIVGIAWDRVVSISLPVFRAAFEKLGAWLSSDEVSGKINKWATDLEKWIQDGTAEKDIKQFAENVKAEFKEILDVVNGIIDAFKWISNNVKSKDVVGSTVSGATGNKPTPGQGPSGSEVASDWARYILEGPQNIGNYLFNRKPGTTSAQEPLISGPQNFLDSAIWGDEARAKRPHNYSGPPIPDSPFSSVSGILSSIYLGFQHWWSGSGAFRPFVMLSDEFYRELADTLREVFKLGPGNEKQGEGTGTGGGGGEGRGFGGRGRGMGGGATPAAGPNVPGAPRGQRGGYTFGQMKQMALDAGFVGAEADRMAAIAMVESSGRDEATNLRGEESYGLTQINARAHGAIAKEAYKNPLRAFQLAKMVRDKQGWDAWRNSLAQANQYLRAHGGSFEAEPWQAGPGSGGGQQQQAGDGSATEGRSTFIVHHTAGRGTTQGVIDTLYQRGLGVQYIMDREGNITATGMKSAHILPGSGKGAGLSNANTVGMEIIAKNDADVTKVQIEAAKRFYAQHPELTQVFGHGEVNPGHKEATEGLTVANALRGMTRGGTTAPTTGGKGVLAAAAGVTNGIQAMIGDSIAVGIGKALGVPTEAFSGQTPETIYNNIKDHFDKYSGMTVGLALGSNQRTGGGGPYMAEQGKYIKMITEGLQKHGARVITSGISKAVGGYGQIVEDIKKSNPDIFLDYDLPGSDPMHVHPTGAKGHEYDPAAQAMQRAAQQRRADATAGASRGRQASNDTFNQTVNVYGSDNPEATGRAAADHANRYHTQMARNRGSASRTLA